MTAVQPCYTIVRSGKKNRAKLSASNEISYWMSANVAYLGKATKGDSIMLPHLNQVMALSFYSASTVVLSFPIIIRIAMLIALAMALIPFVALFFHAKQSIGPDELQMNYLPMTVESNKILARGVLRCNPSPFHHH